jgi:hypothetical protein
LICSENAQGLATEPWVGNSKIITEEKADSNKRVLPSPLSEYHPNDIFSVWTVLQPALRQDYFQGWKLSWGQELEPVIGKSEKPRYVKHVKPLLHTCRHVCCSRSFQHIWKGELFLHTYIHQRFRVFISVRPALNIKLVKQQSQDKHRQNSQRQQFNHN